MAFLHFLQVILGIIFVLFLPGFVYSLVFFEGKSIGMLERTAVSLAISAAFVPLFVFICHLAGIGLAALNVFLEISFLSVAGLALHFLLKHGNLQERIFRKR